MVAERAGGEVNAEGEKLEITFGLFVVSSSLPLHNEQERERERNLERVREFAIVAGHFVVCHFVVGHLFVDTCP